jgi:hypothetical protein
MHLLAARAAWQAAGQGNREAAADRDDRQWVMALRSDWDALAAAGSEVAESFGLGSGLEGEKGFAHA